MKLHKLLEPIKKVNHYLQLIDIKGVATNSSIVKPDYLFIAISGFNVDGHEFIEEAIRNGATAVIGERDINELPIQYLEDEKNAEVYRENRELTVPYIQVENSRFALAKVACQFYGNPSRKKKVIGITGTNGKTTTAFMMKSILEDAGYTCALFGSIHNEINGQAFPSTNTTPDALELQKQIALSKDEFIIMEVSSHGISQYRVEGVEFDYCLFTNLDYEHLDYHHDMEEYFGVKARLFDQLKSTGKAIINIYNLWGKKLANRVKEKFLLVYEIGGQDLQIRNYNGLPRLMLGNSRTLDMKLNVLGKHNLLNACMALLTTQLIGIPEKQILKSLENFSGVPGRFEMINHPKGATIVVDYAHTADAFYNCLETIREQGAKRIFHIFGFRGNRDSKKRAQMVEVSKDLCDNTILTTDDLNGVSADEMLQTLLQLHDEVVKDRTLAIQNVLEQVEEGDWVCITGKGAELYQEAFQIPTTTDKETVEFLIKQVGE